MPGCYIGNNVSSFERTSTRIVCRTNTYPIAFVSLLPLSGLQAATLPTELSKKWKSHKRLLLVFVVPTPMYESAVRHPSSPSLPMIPRRTLTHARPALKPSRLQFRWSDDIADGISDFHFWRPRFVARYLPSANKLYSELPGCFREIKRRALPTFIPMHISLNEVLQ